MPWNTKPKNSTAEPRLPNPSAVGGTDGSLCATPSPVLTQYICAQLSGLP
jgi:hypothetical protein